MKIKKLKEKKQTAQTAIEILKEKYPDSLESLEYADAFQLLVATRLAAQCTDARVNKITPDLFGYYPTMQDMANADVKHVEKLIYSCGFYRVKSQDIVDMSKMLIEKFDGVVPDTIEELTTLPGIGRKTANIIYGDVYGKPAVAADTHCIRITGRLGLTENSKDPYKVEMILREILPPEESNDFCHRLVLFGRETCSARSPKCNNCILSHVCKYYEKNTK